MARRPARHDPDAAPTRRVVRGDQARRWTSRSRRGRARSAVGRSPLEYPIWMWHWALPDDFAVPWLRARSVPLTQSDIQRKRAAAECFRSQLMPPDGHGPPVVPPFVMRRLLAVGEVVFV